MVKSDGRLKENGIQERVLGYTNNWSLAPIKPILNVAPSTPIQWYVTVWILIEYVLYSNYL